MILPYTAINYASSNLLDEDTKSSAKSLVNLLCRWTRAMCALKFLAECLKHRVIPRFIEDWFSAIPDTPKKSVVRKLRSLKRELIRNAMDTQRQRLKQLQMNIGFEYLHVTRRCSEEFVTHFLELLTKMVQTEADAIQQRHRKKWTALTNCHFPICAYHLDYAPRFPFSYVDRFWCVRSSNVGTHAPSVSDKFINETSIDLPKSVSQLMEKGPNFRVPHKFDSKFMDRIKLDLDILTYKLRWFTEVKKKVEPAQVKQLVPFHKNSVKLPPKMTEEKENELILLKEEIMREARKEILATAKSDKFRRINKQVALTQCFFKANNLVAVPSDKTQKLVIADTGHLIDRSNQILANPDTYKQISKSRQQGICNQANKIVKSLGKTLSKQDLMKLLATSGQPAKFQGLIKDHKVPEKDGYPLRPIAAVGGTATEKVDWLISQILGQLIEFVPAHLKNTEGIIDKFCSLERDDVFSDQVFISLDAVKLYPSIPIQFGIDAVIEFANQHWDQINNFGASTVELKNALHFISYNYKSNLMVAVFFKRKVFRWERILRLRSPLSLFTKLKLKRSRS